MNKSLPTRTLPNHPDLDQLKRQAKELREAFLAGEPSAQVEVNRHYRSAEASTFALHDAQLVVARAYGFESWPKLKAFVDGATVTRLTAAVREGDLDRVRAMLKARPELVRMDTAENNEHQALHYAVLERNSEMVRLLMQLGADARKGIYPHRGATTALTLATERGYDELAAIIREEEGRRPETLRSDNSRPPLPTDLMEAVRRGDQERIIEYLEADSMLSQLHFQHPLMTPLHSAAAMLWDRVVVWLLDHGADVNARIDGGPSPFEIVGATSPPSATSTERIAAVAAILRKRGAEMTPRAAVAYGEADWLLARHKENRLVNGLPRNQGYRGLLEMAVTYNQPEILKLLLDLGFDPDEVLRKDDTDEFMRGGPLWSCARTGQTAMAELLINRGATITPAVAVLLGKGDWLRAQQTAGSLENHIGEEGGLISTAIRYDRPEMLELLLDLGLDPDERIRLDSVDEVVFSGGGPLHYCAGSGRLAMAEKLLQRGANPNLHVYAAGPSIWQAYRERDSAMIQLLERHGAVVNPDTAGYLRDVDLARRMFDEEATGKLPAGTVQPGKTVAEEILDPACSGGSPEIVRMALERIAWPREDPRWLWVLRSTLGFWHEIPWIRSSKWQLNRSTYLICFRLILERCDPNLRAERFGQTALHEVAAMGDWITDAEVLSFGEAILDSGAGTNVRDDLLKSTPLGWACRWGRAGLVKLLMDRGADPEEVDAEPWATPKAWAEKMRHHSVRAVLG